MINLIIWFFKIGAFSFGGGIATLPHIYEMANETRWCTSQEVTNLISLSQMTPGPLACNIATFVGNRVNGIIGSILAVMAFIMPAVIFMTFFTKCIKKIEGNKEFNIVMSMVRATGFATIINGSVLIIKNAMFNNPDQIQLSTCIKMLNIRAVIACVIIFYLTKKFKLSAIKALGIGAILGLVIHI